MIFPPYNGVTFLFSLMLHAQWWVVLDLKGGLKIQGSMDPMHALMHESADKSLVDNNSCQPDGSLSSLLHTSTTAAVACSGGV
jgi:hypothetical protein